MRKLFIDMDGVLADYEASVPEGTEPNAAKNIPGFFLALQPMEGAVEAVRVLSEHYDVYVLSTPSWTTVESWSNKVTWIKEVFCDLLRKKVILMHDKSLVAEADSILIDDRLVNGAGNFKGQFIHFGTPDYPDWNSILAELLMEYQTP